MTPDGVALALVGVIVATATAAIPHTMFAWRDARRMVRAVDRLDEPNGRAAVAQAHVRAARFRIAHATVTTAQAFLLVVILLDARRITAPVLAFLLLFAIGKGTHALDTWLASRDRRAILKAAQRRR